MSIRVGIVGIAGYGGGEALRYLSHHPEFKLAYAAGESTAGTQIGERYPGVSREIGALVIQKFDPAQLAGLDLIFTSLPTGLSREPLAKVDPKVRIVDIGGDHRYVDGWTYGLADVWPDEVKGKTRVANPGCYPSAALTAIAPLLQAGLVDPAPPIIIDAKSGISGAGRGGGDSKFGYAECNEDLVAYGLLKHAHVPEIAATVKRLNAASQPRIAFTPHLIPMTRGILATCYLTPAREVTSEQCMAAAREFYKDRPFVRVVNQPPHTKWASGSNLVFVHYAASAGGPIIALGAIDNLGKGAAGQAIQNANLMFGLPAETGFAGASMWP
ncbi:MAG: N-acetyl-gamma-glutamyl-phosphate reductase [Tepidisphaeraceae bacterium]